VSNRHRARFVALAELLAHRRGDIDHDAIAEGRVLVDGRILTNPSARVRADAALRVLPHRRLRGDVKLSHVLDTLAVPVDGRIAIDIGASAGGFTTALLDRGARRVYAVDAGVGQLVGSLRANPKVVNLEGHNLGELSSSTVPDAVDVLTVDVSYLALADAVRQLEVLAIDAAADLVALVKPTFELHRPTLAASDADLADAVALAAEGIRGAGWSLVATCPAPPTGRRGAREVFVHATRSSPAPFW
jgi:23S rRNA (cytidine1920-2'-O)/16S rRNA (cytidine1409-2'-O)-methyltransferase